MILKGECKKCHKTISLDIGDMTIEEVKEKLSNRSYGFECPGHHTEISSPYPTYWYVDEWELTEGKAQTDEEWLADLRSKCKEVRDTNEMHGLIVGFAYGEPMTNDGHIWSFAPAPSGKRYYYRID